MNWDGRYTKAIEEFRASSDDLHRFYAAPGAAKASFEVERLEEARAFAEQAIALAARFRNDWNYGNAMHDGHMVLGRIALKAGDMETAKRRLLEAGRTPGSPQLDSFGPNMSLARDLLERKEVDTVIAYFELCRKFWEMEGGNLTLWSSQAQSGQIPDFGANLFY